MDKPGSGSAKGLFYIGPWSFPLTILWAGNHYWSICSKCCIKHGLKCSVAQNWNVCNQLVIQSTQIILSHTYQYIPIHTQQSGGWGLVLTQAHSCPQFWHSKTNSNSTQFCWTLFWGFKGFDCKSNAKLLGQCSSTAWAVGLASTNTLSGCFWVCGSRWGQQQALLRKTCYHSCHTDAVRESKRLWCFVDIRQRESLFFSCKMKFSMKLARSCCRVNADQSSTHSFTQSFNHSFYFICLRVKIWHRNKTACS